MALDLNDLDGPQRKIVRDALLAAFDEAALDMLLQDDMDRPPLAQLVANKGGFQFMVFDLVNLSRRQGWTSALIEAAEAASGNARLRRLRKTLEASAALDVAGIDRRLRQQAPETSGLERIVRPGSAFADWGLWVARMAEIGHRICRIEYPMGVKTAGGTGFLVAPDLLLTNHHVIEDHLGGQLKPEDIRCRFDFAVGATAPAAPVGLAHDWLVDHSPYSAHDPGDEGGLPDAGELDYALLRLERAVGEDMLDGAARGWMELRQDLPPPDHKAILFIGQHPNLQPLKMAAGTVAAANANGTRLRYDVNTEGGSSGAPCFDEALNVVALHHGGDPDYTKTFGAYNQGIPLPRILALMQTHGVTKFWA